MLFAKGNVYEIIAIASLIGSSSSAMFITILAITGSLIGKNIGNDYV